METVKKENFKVIGIKVRTTNENGQSAIDIGKLWEKFMSNNIKEKFQIKLILLFCQFTPIMKKTIPNHMTLY